MFSVAGNKLSQIKHANIHNVLFFRITINYETEYIYKLFILPSSCLMDCSVSATMEKQQDNPLFLINLLQKIAFKWNFYHLLGAHFGQRTSGFILVPSTSCFFLNFLFWMTENYLQTQGIFKISHLLNEKQKQNKNSRSFYDVMPSIKYNLFLLFPVTLNLQQLFYTTGWWGILWFDMWRLWRPWGDQRITSEEKCTVEIFLSSE